MLLQTQAMMISTQHLMPTFPPASTAAESAEDPGKAQPPSGTETADTPATSEKRQGKSNAKTDKSGPPTGEPSSTDGPGDIIDIEDESKAPGSSAQPSTAANGAKPSPGTKPSTPTYPGGFAIDVCFEASKLPLDVAIFNSARAAGGDEKIRKYLQAVLVIGGTALIPGMAHALESRHVVSLFFC
jgi:actin-related protein 8